jgi:ubiquinone/menaquinone biosynthesis C-methylase UbiE/DNA-binding transcriptional ArsR family regulator
MLAPVVPLLDSFTALADSTRCRMLLILEQHELTVSEFCLVLQLPQSTVSRHLKTLSDAGLVVSRRDGTSRYYSLALEAPAELRTSNGDVHASGNARTPQAELWSLARRELVDRPGAAQDAHRLERVLAARSETSQQFFATSAGQWDQLRDELFGDQFYWRGLLALLPSSWAVGDLGCGTGAIMAALAPHVAEVIGVDGSDEMLKAAAARLAPPFKNVQLRRGALEALPIDDASLDAATLVLVLHHLPSPALALAEAFRVLKPGGRVLIVDMTPHEREEYRQQMGHVWLGFSEDQICRLLGQARFADVRCHSLPAVTEAKGPALFAAVACKRSNHGERGEHGAHEE